MSLNKKAGLLTLICVILFLSLSFAVEIPLVLLQGADVASGNAGYILSALMVSVPSFLIPAIIFRRKNGFPIAKLPRATHMLIALGIGIGCIMLNQALTYLNQALLSNVIVESNTTDATKISHLSPVIMIISLGIIPPISEEFIMRGTLTETWRRTSPIGAALLSSFIFMLLHSAPSGFLVYIGMGLLLASVYLITRNVWLSVIVHMVNNMASVIAAISLASNPDELSEAAQETGEAAAVSPVISSVISFFIFGVIAAVILVPLLFLLVRIYKNKKLGMFAEEAPVPGGIAEGTPEAAAPAYPNVPGYVSDWNRYATLYGESRPEGVNEDERPGENKKDRILGNVFIWIALVILIVMNVYAGLYEFGLLK